MSLRKYLKPVGCLSARSSVVEACREMKRKGIGAIVVVSDDHKAIGVLTDRDVAMRVVAAGKQPERTTVCDVMTRAVASLPVDASIMEASQRMSDCGLRRLPITDEHERVVGLVSFDDLVVLLASELGNLANALIRRFAHSVEEDAAAWQE